MLIDPFKNVQQEIRTRDDIFLEQLFAKFKEFAVTTNSSVNWIAHPKANIARVRSTSDGDAINVCDQYMLNGGAAWNNSMDGIYSILRPYTLQDPRDSNVWFYNLKQRKQELVAERGIVKDIRFDIGTRRYLFNERDPLGKI